MILPLRLVPAAPAAESIAAGRVATAAIGAVGVTTDGANAEAAASGTAREWACAVEAAWTAEK
jgi:hypothetical protein